MLLFGNLSPNRNEMCASRAANDPAMGLMMGIEIAYPRVPEGRKRALRIIQTDAVSASNSRTAGIYGSSFAAKADARPKLAVRGMYVSQRTGQQEASEAGKDHRRSVAQPFARAEIDLRPGERPKATDAAIEILRERGDLYERSGELVRICGRHILPVDECWLTDYLARHIRFFRFKQNGDDWIRREADPPGWLAKVIAAKMGERGLPELTGIITVPILRSDGSLIDQPGFDSTTGLLLLAADWPAIPNHPDLAQLRQAWRVLWRPFSEFPYASNEDRGATVAAILTATVRRTLPRAPAISFDAPSAGSGKTLLATCIAELAGGEVAVIPECRDEEELRKRLLSSLRAGQPSILLDNVKGQFASSALEAFLTDDNYSDRVLGASQMLRLPTNVLVLISGNNFLPRGDLWRRIITARIDAKAEHAERRCFALDARRYCREHRQGLVVAALILLRGFIDAGKPRFTNDRLASFEAWDDLIRQCVLWIGRKEIAPLGDPTASVANAKEREPERQKLAAFLKSASAVMGVGSHGIRWRTGDLIQKAKSAPLCDENAQALHDVLLEIAGERQSINPRILGRWIERHTDDRCGGLYVARAGERRHAVLWRIQSCN